MLAGVTDRSRSRSPARPRRARSSKRTCSRPSRSRFGGKRFRRYGLARRRAGCYLRPLGRLEESLAEITRAIELDPLWAFTRSIEPYQLLLHGENSQAVERARDVIELFPWYWLSYLTAAIVLGATGLRDEALSVLRRVWHPIRRTCSYWLRWLSIMDGAGTERRPFAFSGNSKRQPIRGIYRRALLPLQRWAASISTGLTNC
jgi:tetratricopeptide (TPR) repeat protein